MCSPDPSSKVKRRSAGFTPFHRFPSIVRIGLSEGLGIETAAVTPSGISILKLSPFPAVRFHVMGTRPCRVTTVPSTSVRSPSLGSIIIRYSAIGPSLRTPMMYEPINADGIGPIWGTFKILLC